MSAEALKCVRLRITGRVQGVWYRGWTVDQARALGLDGWVRNRRDGSVEAVVSGPAERVDELIARCHVGPPSALVDRVEVTPESEPVARGFHQKPTI
jgi:acylphosphatase